MKPVPAAAAAAAASPPTATQPAHGKNRLGLAILAAAAVLLVVIFVSIASSAAARAMKEAAYKRQRAQFMEDRGVRAERVLPSEPTRWVTTELSGGLGNCLFQAAAMLAHARATGRTPVLLQSSECPNACAAVPTVLQMLPALRLLHDPAAPPRDLFESIEYDAALVYDAGGDRGVVLRGYWQAWALAAAAYATPSPLYTREAIDDLRVVRPACTRAPAPRPSDAVYPPLRNPRALHVTCNRATAAARAALRAASAGAADVVDGPRVPPELVEIVRALLPEQPWEITAFVHVRRGDYFTAWGEPQCLPPSYTAAAVRRLAAAFARRESAAHGGRQRTLRLLLCSDDDAWLASAAPLALLPTDAVLTRAPPSMTAAETLVAMSLCAVGGVTANSTLSWWGGALGVMRAAAAGEPAPLLFVPAAWQTFAPPEPRVLPPWMQRVPVPEWATPQSRRAAHAHEPFVSPPRPRKPLALVINLDARRHDKWPATYAAWSPYFDVQRLPAVATPGNGAVGCSLSHVAALRVLEASDAETLIVLEDDAQPTDKMGAATWAALVAALAKLEGWMACNAGPSFDELRGDVSQLLPLRTACCAADANAPSAPVRLFATPNATMSHFVVYHRRALPWIGELEANARTNYADRWWNVLHPVPVIVPSVVLASQRPAVSDIVGEFRDYSASTTRAQALLDKAVALADAAEAADVA